MAKHHARLNFHQDTVHLILWKFVLGMSLLIVILNLMVNISVSQDTVYHLTIILGL
jgi:hypothetical protein